MTRVVTTALCLAALGGCEAGTQPRAERRPDKAALYGDPGLIPTREGEHARRELAAAGEVAALLGAAGELMHPRVTVELPGPGGAGPTSTRVVIGGRRTASTSESEIRRVVAAVIGDEAAAGTELVLAAETSPPSEPDPGAPLYLALLGLGAWLGVLGERLRVRGRAIRRWRAGA